jgi:hypothetical protein
MAISASDKKMDFLKKKTPIYEYISLKKALIFYDLIGVLCLFQLLTARITSKLTPKKSHIGSSCKILVPEALEVLSLECLDSILKKLVLFIHK